MHKVYGNLVLPTTFEYFSRSVEHLTAEELLQSLILSKNLERWPTGSRLHAAMHGALLGLYVRESGGSPLAATTDHEIENITMY